MRRPLLVPTPRGGFRGNALPRIRRRSWVLVAALCFCLAGAAEASTFLPQVGGPENPDALAALGIDPEQEFFTIDDMVFRTSDVLESGFSGTPWPGGVMYYSFDSTVDGAEPSQWLAAAAKWAEVANVTFVQRTNQPNYVRVHDSGPGGGNNSFVGMQGGAQTMNITSWGATYIIAHEIGHAFGLWHEQQRSDRNTYVTINTANIQSGAAGNFSLMPNTTNYGPYDFDSVMHYDQCAFSIDCPIGTSCGCTHPTITVLPPNQSWQGLIGQSNHLSYHDQRGMGQRYGCLTPSSPFPLTPANGATGAPNTGIFDWTNVAGGSSYWLIVLCAAGDTAISTRVTTSSYTYSLPSGNYTWQVFAFNPCELMSGPFLVYSLGVGGAGTPCNTPAPFEPTPGATCQPTAGVLRWTSTAGAAGYYVRVSSGCGAGTETFTASPEFYYSGLATNTTYHWQVRPSCACVAASYSACVSFTTVEDQAPPVPLPQSPVPGALGQPLAGRLEWGVPQGASAFRVQIGTSCGTGTEYEIEEPTFDYSGLAQGTTYFWRVASRGCDLWSAYSSCRSFTTTTLSGSDRVYLGPGQSLAAGQTLAEIPIRIENLTDLQGFGLRVQFSSTVFDYLGWSVAGTRADGAATTSATFSPGGGGQPAEVIANVAFPAGPDCPPQIAAGDGVVFRILVAVRPGAPLGPTPVTVAAGTLTGCGGASPVPGLGSGTIQIATPVLAGPETSEERPRALRFETEGPNPARGMVAFRFGLPAAAPVSVAIFDLSGREVARLTEGLRPAGWHRLTWDGTGADGRAAPNGIYMARLTSGSDRLALRMVRLR